MSKHNVTLQTVRSMLFGLATADALGVPVEFTRRSKREADPVEGMRSGGSWDQPAGTWSDDTSLTLATMESLARLRHVDLDDIMHNFVRWLEHDEFTANGNCFDVGNTTARGIKNFIDGASALECGVNTPDSNGNGSLMRIIPVPVWLFARRGSDFDHSDMETIHHISALTHAHARSLIACGIYSLIAAQILNGLPKVEALNNGLERAKNYYSSRAEFADELKYYHRVFEPDFAQLSVDEINSRGYVVDSLEAALWCLLTTTDYRSMALKAVNLGGDTDTIGAIAGGLGGLVCGVENIPTEWLNTLRNRALLEQTAQHFSDALST